MARKKALRDSPAGKPRQGVKVCDLLNSETVPLRYMLRISQRSLRRPRSLFFLRFKGFPHLLA